MESVNKRVIVIAVVMALFTSFLIYIYVKKVTTKPDVREYVKVYVAAKTLPAKYKIAEEDIKQINVDKEYLNSKAALNKADIEGKSLKDRIIEGEQILKDRLVEDKKMAMAYNIPEGKRAVSITVNEQMIVSGLVRPGDFVDIIASFDKEDYDDKNTKISYPKTTKIVMQNVQILALAQDQIIADEKLKELPKTMTVAVTPQDAEKLVFISDNATLRLALRPVGDDKNVDTQGTIRTDITMDKGVRIVPK
jgi:pilus assembly protein CpaB